MRIFANISCVQFVVAILMACAFLLAPAADAEHLAETAEISCEKDHASETGSIEEETHGDHEGHDHHAHCCGTCHLHVVRRDPDVILTPTFIAISTFPLLDDQLEASAFDGPYRPPRA